jgi:hypothetical protein
MYLSIFLSIYVCIYLQFIYNYYFLALEELGQWRLAAVRSASDFPPLRIELGKDSREGSGL